MPRIETGHSITKDVQVVPGKRVRFVADDDRTMFEVEWNSDGKSISIRGVETSIHDGQILSERLDLRLNCANEVTVMARPYEE